MAELKAVRVLYLDLDGTVRKGLDELGHFVNGPDDVELFPGMAKLLAAYKAEGWRIVAITNQGGVALGHLSFENAVKALIETQRQAGGAFDTLMICTHHPDAQPPHQRCWCRKPRAGMVIEGALRLKREHPDEYYPAHLALLVGDRDEDRGAAEAANIDFLPATTWRGLARPVSAESGRA